MPPANVDTAHVTLLQHQGRMDDGVVLRNRSLAGLTFTGKIAECLELDGVAHVVPTVTGTPFPTGRHDFVLSPLDPLPTGLVI